MEEPENKGNIYPCMPNIMIVEARFYTEISDYLATGALAAVEQAGARAERFAVPGALEIPAAIDFALCGGREDGRFDAIVALGCVIRGETAHYDIVCNESARGAYDVTRAHGVPFGNGILTCETYAQAQERADPDRKDKGGEAVKAALALLELKRTLGVRSKK